MGTQVSLVPTDFHLQNEKKRNEKKNFYILYAVLPSNTRTWRQFARHTYAYKIDSIEG